VKISPKGWKNTFCEGRTYPVYSYLGNYEDMVIELPQDENVPVHSFPMDGPRFVSTLNSDRISMVLANNGIPMENISVIELNPVLDAWPRDFLNKFASKREWPYLVLTSPFAAKCAIIAAESNPDIARIQWLAIGEGTARACFRRGVTVAICAKSRNSNELVSYIAENIDSKTPLLIPRSNVAPNDVVHNLQQLGYSIDHWIGYENRPKSVDDATLSADDVLLLSSSSSAISWAENGLVVPNEIICMGNNARETILSLDHFQGSNVSVLKGPTTEYLMQWWKENRGR
jgi:uroporphyrinogen-III synthase